MTDILETIRNNRRAEEKTLTAEVARIDTEIALLEGQVKHLTDRIAGFKERRDMAMTLLSEIGLAPAVYNPYHDIFGCWADVVSNYAITGDEAKEPDEVLYAQYEYGDYSGSSEVIIRRGTTYYWNTGSHCSCYGLEGQWEPVSYDDPKVLAASLERHYRRNDTWGPIIDRLAA